MRGHAAPKAAWLGFILMTVGGLMANVVVLVDPRNTVAYTAYLPLKASRSISVIFCSQSER
ncbi:MAG: hypothetical protein U0V48_00030 [Anaerolineales bacterium]